MPNDTPDIGPLYRIMARLRSEDGCPWDRQQDHETLKPYLIEEAYEVIEAIDGGDAHTLCEELGDLLLQIVFHSRLAEEVDAFGLDDVIEAICEKMIRRHPHVFGDERAETPNDVRDRWEQIKAAEGRSLFDGTPRSLPALLRAQRVSEKASGVGFDWSSYRQVLDKVREELGELEEALAHFEDSDDARARRAVVDELGDLLFATSSLARHLGIVGEDALRSATYRFERRFAEVQKLATQSERRLEDCDEAELDALWERAKLELSRRVDG